MRSIFILIFIFSIYNNGWAQKKRKRQDSAVVDSSFIFQPNRIEFEIGPKDIDFQIIPAEEQGLLVVKSSRNRNKEGWIWSFNMVDTTLNVSWTVIHTIPFGANFLGYDYSNGAFFLLFGESSYKLEEMKVMKVDIVDGRADHYEVNTVFPVQLTEFEVVGNTLVFGGYANFRPVVMLYDMIEKKPKVLPGFYNNNSDILEIRIDDEQKAFTVILNERTFNKKITIALKTFTEHGEMLQTKALESDYEKSLIDGVSTTFESGVQYVAGTYARKKSEYSRGLYLAKLQGGEQLMLKYHNYADLENFFSYMKAKREQRVKDRISRRKVKGRKVKFNYRLLVHDIIQRGDEYILIGEAYYPKYSTYGGGGYYDAPYQGNSRQNWADPNFVGYKYTHAVVVGFDRSGNVVWDNSFEINDVLSTQLTEFVKVSTEEDRIVLLYIYEDVLRSKIIEGSQILEGKSFDPIALHFQSDEIKDNSKEMEGLENWYDTKFYAYGIQNIKNLRDQNVKLNRKVFYINKVQYK